MSMIEHLESRVLYTNPVPHVRSRHGFFPGLVELPSGDLLALLVITEAFEAANGTTWVARSADRGSSWTVESPLYDKRSLDMETTDSFKPTVLRNGTLVATGYRFFRHDPEQGIGIAETGGILPGDDIVAFSSDEGRSWTTPRIIPRSRPELSEISGPSVELQSGELLAVAGLYPLPDGTHPSGMQGPNIIAYEPRVCQMEDGRVVAILWAYDPAAGEHHTNRVVVSHDDGHTWSAPIDTGHRGQASNVMALGGNLLATIHAHRAEDPGVYFRIIDFSGDRWRPVAEAVIYGSGSRPQTQLGQGSAEMFTSLRFGQPSLLRLSDGQLVAYHWAVEDGQGKIRFHRLRLKLPA
ncbi:MAG: sialidase family protein [Acidobacteria bacterium]|nr:sialidase family protein [Acidobacteriota bacterium]